MTERVDAEVVVVGAGPAGVAAACCLAESGIDVLVVDESPRPGGQIWRHRKPGDLPVSARTWLGRLTASGARHLVETSIVDAEPDGVLLAESLETSLEIRGRRIILATGARELFLPYPGWTLPGVVGVGAIQALVKAGVEIRDQSVVLAGSGPLLLPVGALLQSAGARVSVIAEQASAASVARFSAALWRQPRKIAEALGYRWRTLRIPYRFGVWVVAAHGDTAVREVELTDGSQTWSEPCDLLGCSAGLVPNTELARLMGCDVEKDRVVVDENQSTTLSDVYCVGESTGIGGAEKSLLEGQLAAAHLTADRRRLDVLQRRHRRLRRFSAELSAAFEPRSELGRRLEPETIVCRCEDVKWQDLDPDWDVRQAKLYTRSGMGPCQGRVCGAALRQLCGWGVDSVRPPVAPSRISSLIR